MQTKKKVTDDLFQSTVVMIKDAEKTDIILYNSTKAVAFQASLF